MSRLTCHYLALLLGFDDHFDRALDRVSKGGGRSGTPPYNVRAGPARTRSHHLTPPSPSPASPWTTRDPYQDSQLVVARQADHNDRIASISIAASPHGVPTLLPCSPKDRCRRRFRSTTASFHIDCSPPLDRKPRVARSDSASAGLDQSPRKIEVPTEKSGA